jgi:ATP-dependent DNA helicase RecQ
MALRRRQIAEKAITPEQRRIEEKRLAAMIDLCEGALCRRQALLAYFGEAAPACGHCDLCRDSAAGYDATIDAQKVLSAVMRTGQRFGAAHIAHLLTGESTDAIRRFGHDALKTFGVGKDRSRRAWMATARQLFAAGFLAEASAEHGGFKLTEAGEAVLRGRQAVTLRVVSDTKPARRSRRDDHAAAAGDLDAAARALFDHLRRLRLEIARREGIAAFMVFADRSLIDMARQRPANALEFKAIHGVGEAKLSRYGAAFLAAIRGFTPAGAEIGGGSK